MGQPEPVWRSIDESSIPSPPPIRPRTARKTARSEGPRAPAWPFRLKLFLVLGIPGAILVLGVLIAVVSSGGPPQPPPPAPLAAPGPPPVRPPTVAKPPAPAGPKTLVQKMADLEKREKADPKAFGDLIAAWTALLSEPASEAVRAEIRDQVERLQGEANKEYRERHRAVQDRVRGLMAARRSREALEALKEWKVPAELDLTGALAEDHRKEMAAVGEIVRVDEGREKILADYRKGDFSADPDAAFAPQLASPSIAVRSEAEAALPELKVLRALGLMGRALDARRGAATARIEEVKREIARDAAADKSRRSGWEARLRERTRLKPIPIRQLGVDMEVPLQVAKYTGRSIVLAGQGIELTFGLDDLPAEVISRLLAEAPDPARSEELLEAGRMAVRRGLFPAAEALFEKARQADPSVADALPDLERLRRGVGTFRGQASLAGDLLSLQYEFRRADEEKDFIGSPSSKLTLSGGLHLSGKGFFYAVPGELRFQKKLKVTAQPAGLAGDGAYIVGASTEAAPGESDLLVALLSPGRGFRVLRFPRGGTEEILGEGDLPSAASVEVSFASPKLEVKIDGRPAWSGAVGELGPLRPLAGGVGFEGASAEAGYRLLRFEGTATPRWVQRLQSERLTMVESELSKERRITKEERAARFMTSDREFGKGYCQPLAVEAELRPFMPAKVATLYAGMRDAIARMQASQTADEEWGWAGKARGRLEESVREAPWFPLTYYYRAEWLYLTGDPGRAFADLEEAARLQPGFVEVRLARANLLVRQAKYAEAGRELDLALGAVPDLPAARLTRALLHYYGGRDAEAVAELEIARRLEPGDVGLRRAAKRLGNAVAGPAWSGMVTVETPNYTIRAEAPKGAKKDRKADPEKAARERAERYGAHLEAARGYFATLVPGGAAQRARKPIVYIFDSPEGYYSYADFASEDRLEHTEGVFLPRYQQLLFFRGETEEATFETLSHEAFHEHLQSVLPGAPTWLNEGVAEYCAGLSTSAGRVSSSGRVIRGRVRDLVRAFDSGWDGFPFATVFRETPEQFYKISPELQYAQAWSMVHFLVHAKGGKHRPLLDKYIRLLGETRSSHDALQGAFGGEDLVALQREWVAYVRGLR